MLKIIELKYLFRFRKPRKIHKKQFYGGIPFYHKPNQVDIHDGYVYRTKQQVMEQLKNLNIQAKIKAHCYSQSDPHKFLKDRKAMMQINTKGLKFTHLQLQRFKLLMGVRFNEKEQKARIVCEMFPTYDQNVQKMLQQIYEVVLQAKRAP